MRFITKVSLNNFEIYTNELAYSYARSFVKKFLFLILAQKIEIV